MSRRYALYLAPPNRHPLWALGCAWLGRDAESGAHTPPPAGIGAAWWQSITAEPRRYGLHATLKAPFRLASGQHEDDLLAALARFATARAPFDLPLVVSELSGFACLRPAAESIALQGLADACVREFEPFRAALTPEELARRHPDRLDDTGRALLERWGYPHVFERFRCHFTLSGTLTDAERGLLLPQLANRFAPALVEPLRIDQLALFVEDHPGADFRLVRRFAFEGTA